jgi:arylsulfatase A-like enzyme
MTSIGNHPLAPQALPMRIRPRLLIAFTSALVALSTFAAERPNIVLVMADDQGWGDMAYYGHPHLKTPHFDAMSREAVRFDRFYAAAPVCSPTRASVMTGRTPNRSAVYSWGHALRPQETTIAEALKQAGYRTGHFGKWHLGSVQAASAASPGAQGFDEWVSAPNFYDLDPVLSDQGKAVPFKGDSSDIAAELALQFIRRASAAKRPFLAVVWFGSPHSPYQAIESDQQLYAGLPDNKRNFYGEITGMDRAFGRLRSELKQMGLSENTILWYCSDNGALPQVGSPGNRRGLKASIYEGGLAVPGLLEWPAKIKRPRVIDVPCVTSDIYPTLLEIAGVKVANQPTLDGVSLLPLLEGRMAQRPQPIGFWDVPVRGIGTPAKQWMDELYADQKAGREPSDPLRLARDAATIKPEPAIETLSGHAAWLDGSWKLHRIISRDSSAVKWELYDLASDPREEKNLVVSESQRTATMQRQLDAWMQSVVRSQAGSDYR